MEYIHNLIWLCPLLFIAGFIDSIAGGGGLIALPAYMMCGMPIYYVYGCKCRTAYSVSDEYTVGNGHNHTEYRTYKCRYQHSPEKNSRVLFLEINSISLHVF